MRSSLSSFFPVTFIFPSAVNSMTVPAGTVPSSALLTVHLPTIILA